MTAMAPPPLTLLVSETMLLSPLPTATELLPLTLSAVEPLPLLSALLMIMEHPKVNTETYLKNKIHICIGAGLAYFYQFRALSINRRSG